MRRAKTLALTMAVALLLGAVAIPANAASSVVISNEYIKIIVNAETSENGRFGVETTGGDPANPNDDNLPLIYGRPVPWTSYTTIRIDGQDWVFGGKASKRAGAGGKYGALAVAPTAKGSSITTSYLFGDIRATQDLSFARNHMTGYNDTVRIAYTLKNEGTAPATVGLRLMLDTMLGKNDGAPLRAGESTIVSDRSFAGSTLPDFWQAFDSLAEPSVTSQATLIGKELTPPGSVIFSNWGAFADSLWDVRLVPGRDFTREGEFDLDSAAAMFWDGYVLQPGSQVTLVTYYGLGGIVVAPGNLSLGLAAPAEVAAPQEGQESSFTVVAYIQNTGKGPALDVKVSLELPKGLEVVAGSELVRSVGDMKQGAITQLSWRLRTDAKTFGALQLKLKAESSNAEGNSISRSVEVLSPPRLSLRLVIPEIKLNANGALKESYPVVAQISNLGDSAAYWTEASLELTGARLLPGDSQGRQLGHFQPGMSYEAVWFVSPLPGSPAVQFKAKAAASNAKQVAAQSATSVPLPTRSISLELGAYSDGFIEAKVSALRLFGVAKIEFDIAWQGDALALLGRKPVAAGALMLLPDGTSPGLVQGKVEGRAIRGISCSFLPGGEPTGTLVSIDFKIAGPGMMTINMENVKAFDAAGKLLQIQNDGLMSIIK